MSLLKLQLGYIFFVINAKHCHLYTLLDIIHYYFYYIYKDEYICIMSELLIN
jgi:hypothetical protein